MCFPLRVWSYWCFFRCRCVCCVSLAQNSIDIFTNTLNPSKKNCNNHLRKSKKKKTNKKMEVSPGRRCQTRSRSSAAARRRRRRNEANETAKKVVESPANRVPAGLLLSWTYSPPPPLPPQMPRVGSSHSLSTLSLSHSLFLFAPFKNIFQQGKKKA